MYKSNSIDENRYSRQILSLGMSSQVKLVNSIVKINGLVDNGILDLEVTKNLVLQGVGGLILSGTINREKELKSFLEKINPSCKIYLSTDKTPESNLEIMLNKRFDSDKPMIYSCVGGCRGFIFNDFKNHLVEDTDGETPSNLVIKNISISEEKTIIIETNEYHKLGDGDEVTFSNLEGEHLEFLNDKFIIQIINQNNFKLLMSSLKHNNFKFYNGNVKKIKKSIEIKFESYHEQIENPTLSEDWINPDNPRKLFNYWKLNELNPEDKMELGPVSAFFGGLIASEVIKFITNKYIPINQWYFWEDISYLNYDSSGRNAIEKIIGKESYHKLINGKWFMIGSGAIGCEILKNLAHLNFATGENGKLFVTDPDTIEVSNLSRQFLFHKKDVNKHKSTVAVEKIKQMVPQVNFIALTDKMSPETEDKYSDTFYNQLDGMINALDNYQARLYMDNKALKYSLPLFESGTQGPKGNTQPVIPKLTENYGATTDPPESESYPLCTIKNFPNKPEHVIHYVKEMFEEWWDDFPLKVNQYIKDKSYLSTLSDNDKNQLISKMNLFFSYSKTVEGQAEFWNNFYYKNFRDNILQILEKYPKDHKIDGNPFWTGGKKCPQEPDDKIKIDFIKSGLKLSEILYQEVFDDDELDFTSLLLSKVTPNISKTNIAINEDELEEQNKITHDEKLVVIPQKLKQISYDKDILEHYQWLYYSSLIRAKSYYIDFPDILKTRQISGKIIPAMATTTSIVSGLISLEILKFYQNREIEDYRSYFLNLTLNQYLYSEPNPSKRTKYGTIWDNYSETNDITVDNIIEKYSKIFDTEVDIIVSDTKIIYAPFISNEEDKNLKLSELGLGTNFTLQTTNDDEDELPLIYVKLNN